MQSDQMGLVEHPGLDAALRAASADAAASGARVFPCTVFQQGRRTMISTSFPFPFLARQVVADSAAKGSNPAGATNRPLMTDHVKAINLYVKENPENYILPPVTLNARQLPAIHAPRGNFKNRMGFMVVDDSVRFYVTDGQHRIAAIKGIGSGRSSVAGLVDSDEGFEGDGLAVLIVVEQDLKAIHQDFADAAQTKQIPASLLAVYNTREPINGVLTDIVDRTKFFRDRIDATSKTLPKMSQSVFLLNQVRQFVKELLFADYALAEGSVSKASVQRIGTREAQEAFVEEAVMLVDTLSEHMEPWREICGLPTASGVGNKIPDLRQMYINLTATGLVVIGRVAYEIMKNPNVDERRALYCRLAAEIDWRRGAEIWRNRIVSQDGKIATQRGPVRDAANQVLKALGFVAVNPEDSFE
ncbi:DNA sulfur modification protein DndB [Streptomyces sp. NPDC002553]|uniref:DNA sulfur modification protein DndB n=1 Tax=Streptomyces sp. NPDC002553 TaxID=3154417 RepID=UPI00331EA88A